LHGYYPRASLCHQYLKLTIYAIKWQILDKEPNEVNDQSLMISAACFKVQLVTSFQTLIESRIVES